MSVSEAMERAEVAALVAMGRAGLANDHQELLTYGDPMRSIPPRLLRAALRAAFPILAEELVRLARQHKFVALPDASYEEFVESVAGISISEALRTRISEIAGGRDG